MHKAVKKNNVIRRNVEALVLHNGAPKFIGNTTQIVSLFLTKIVNLRVKNVVPVWFIQEQFDNGLFIQK